MLRALQNMLIGLGALLLVGCSRAPAVSAETLQSLADAACACNRTAKDRRAYDDNAPSSCWTKFDAALKLTRWDYMPVAADGPVSGAAVCIGSGGDSCAPKNQVWIEHGLGACSDIEAQDRFRRFDACLKTNGGDEIKCGNALI